MYPIKVMKASCRRPPAASSSRPAGRLINPCGAGKKSRGHPIPRLIRAPQRGGGGQEGAGAEGRSGLRISPAAFPVAGGGGGALRGERGEEEWGNCKSTNKERTRSPQGSRAAVWIVANPRNEDKGCPMREPCLAAEPCLQELAGDYCLVSTYYGPGTRVHVPQDSPNPLISQRRKLLFAPRTDEETRRPRVSWPSSDSDKAAKTGVGMRNASPAL